MAFWSKTTPPSTGVTPVACCAHSCTDVTEIQGSNSQQKRQMVYIFGGWTGTRMINDLYVFQTATMTWNRPSTINHASPRAGHSMNAIGKKILVFGGSDSGIFYNDLQILDLDKLEWTVANVSGAPPCARSRHTCNLVGTKLYIFGGGDEKKLYNDLYCLDTITLKWQKIESRGKPPSPRWGHSTTLVDGKLFVVFGGHDGAKRLNDVHVLSLETMEWTQPKITNDEATLPPPRAGHTSDFVGRKIFVFGGGDGYVLNDLYSLEVDTFTWSKIACTSPGRCAHSSVAIDGKLFIFGGGNGIRCFKDMYIFDAAEYLKMEEAKQAKIKNKQKVKQRLEVLLEQKFKHGIPPEMNQMEAPETNSNIPPPPPMPDAKREGKAEVNNLKKSGSGEEKAIDIRTWLKELGLERYIDHFVKEDIDMSLVPFITENHLIKMGIDSIRARLVLLSAISAYQTKRDSDERKRLQQVLKLVETMNKAVKTVNEATLYLSNHLPLKTL